MSAVRDFNDLDLCDGFEEKVADFEKPKIKPSLPIQKVPLKDTIVWKIFDDIVYTGSMPLLTAFFHDYDFYPLDVNPEQLTVWEHFKVYMNHLPFVLFYYANIVLRGVGQVFICNHPITGLFVCMGLYLSSPMLLVYALLGAIYENVAAYLICKPIIGEMEAGLYG